jgi:hypothetical protein
LIEERPAEADAKTEAPRFRLPELPGSDDFPQRRETTSAGEVYLYELPARWRAADRVAPNMGLSQDVAVMSWLPVYTQRLLAPQPLKVEGSLADAERPMAAAAYLNFAGIIDALQPWLERASERRQERLAAREEARQKDQSSKSLPRAAETAVSRSVPSSRVSQAPAPRAVHPAPSTRAPQPRASTRVPSPPPTAQTPAPRASTSASPRAPLTRVPQPPSAQTPAETRSVAEARATEVPVRRISPEEAKERLRFTLDLLRCLRSFSFATHREGDALVTHYQILIEDLPE